MTDNGTNQIVCATITGSGGTLSAVDQNAASVIQIQQGSTNNGPHNAVLDLSGLGTLNLTAGRLLVASNPGSSPPGASNYLSGSLNLAQTNFIQLIGTSTPSLIVGDALSNANTSNTNLLQLGLTNTIFVDSLTIARAKSEGLMRFNPLFSGNHPSLYLRGNSSPSVASLVIGDNVIANTSYSSTGTLDLSLGVVNAQVANCYVARGQVGTNTGGATGTLTLGAGIFNVNAMYLATVPTNNANANVTGTVNVTGTATLVVNSNLALGTNPNTNTAYKKTASGTLNITNGTVYANAVTTGSANGVISTINVNSGTFYLTNTAGTPAQPLSALNCTSATLHLNASPGVTNIVVTNFAGSASIIIDSIAYSGGTVSYPLISYIEADPYTNLHLTLPAIFSGSLVDNNGSKRIDLQIANDSVLPSYTNTLPAGSTLIANQVNNSSNTANLFFQNLNGTRDGDTLVFYNCANDSFITNVFNSALPTGFADYTKTNSVPAPVLTPGLGFIYNALNSNSVTFSGAPNAPVLPPILVCGEGNFYYMARQTNDLGTYENITGFYPADGAQVQTLENGSFVTNAFLNGAWTLGEPTLPVGIAANIFIPTNSVCATNPLYIANNPAGQNVYLGSNAVFTVTVFGTGPFAYQWQCNGVNLMNGTNVSGALTSCLVITNVQTSNAGIYSVIVSNFSGFITSTVAPFTVNLALVYPAVKILPQNQTVDSGMNVTLNATAVGAVPLSYQWLFNGTNLESSVSSTLALTNIQTNQSGFYSLVVSNAYGTINSGPTTVVVNTGKTNITETVPTPKISFYSSTNGLFLVVKPYLVSGILTLQEGNSVTSLTNNPVIVWQTNTPALVPISVPITQQTTSASQMFFRAFFAPDTNIPVASGTISTNGGTITAPVGSAIAGVTLSISPNGYPASRQFGLSYTPIRPGCMTAIGTPVTPIINIENNGDTANDFMTLSLPISTPTNSTLVAALFDPSSEQLDYVPVFAQTNGKIGIVTSHFCNLCVWLTESNWVNSVHPLADSGYRPLVDNWSFANKGTSLFPNALCDAMSISSVWYFENEKAAEGPLFSRFISIPQGFQTPLVPDGNVYGFYFNSELQQLVSACYGNINTTPVDSFYNYLTVKAATFVSELYASGVDPIVNCYLQIQATHQPQIISFPLQGHTVVAYASDGNNVFIVDPNYPLQTGIISLTALGNAVYTSPSGTQYTFPTMVDSRNQKYVGYLARIPNLWWMTEVGLIGQGDFPDFNILVQENRSGDWVAVSKNTTNPNGAISETIRAHTSDIKVSLAQSDGSPCVDPSWVIVNTNGTQVGNFYPQVNEGDNRLGIELVTQSPSGLYVWTAFAWIEINAFLDVPIALDASEPSVSGFTANWELVTGAEGYYIDIATDSEFDDVVIPNEYVGNTNTYSFSGDSLMPDTTYYYRVTAYAGSIESTSSAPVEVKTLKEVPAPQATAPTDVGIANFTANWISDDLDTSYVLVVSTDPLFQSDVVYSNNVGNVTSYTQDDCIPNTTYYYCVYACIDTSMSPKSNVEKATPSLPAPSCYGVYTNLSGFTAGWSLVNGAEGYIIQFSESPSFSSVSWEVDAGQSTSYTISSSLISVEFFYRVCCYYDYVDSAFSNIGVVSAW